jgi:hypothetical protein
MAREPLKITVLKKLSSKEVYGQSLPEVAEDMSPYCDRLEVGQEFTPLDQKRRIDLLLLQ